MKILLFKEEALKSLKLVKGFIKNKSNHVVIEVIASKVYLTANTDAYEACQVRMDFTDKIVNFIPDLEKVGAAYTETNNKQAKTSIEHLICTSDIFKITILFVDFFRPLSMLNKNDTQCLCVIDIDKQFNLRYITASTTQEYTCALKCEGVLANDNVSPTPGIELEDRRLVPTLNMHSIINNTSFSKIVGKYTYFYGDSGELLLVSTNGRIVLVSYLHPKDKSNDMTFLYKSILPDNLGAIIGTHETVSCIGNNVLDFKFSDTSVEIVCADNEDDLIFDIELLNISLPLYITIDIMIIMAIDKICKSMSTATASKTNVRFIVKAGRLIVIVVGPDVYIASNYEISDFHPQFSVVLSTDIFTVLYSIIKSINSKVIKIESSNELIYARVKLEDYKSCLLFAKSQDKVIEHE